MQKQARPPRHSTVFPHNIYSISNTLVLLATDKQLRAELEIVSKKTAVEYITITHALLH